ncbi:MAG: phage portal protein, partial [Acidobacteria bacterium]|nr:phage portal protein [Acidobacteriota bacterium]
IRKYAAANISRSNSDWVTISATSNYETQTSITALRARARQMCRDDAYAQKFLRMAESNVIGSQGIQLDPRAKKPRGKNQGTLHRELNDRVKTAFWEWGSDPKACSSSGKLDLVAQQKLFIRQFLRDGEVLVIKRPVGPWGIETLFLDPAWLDEYFTTINPRTGRRIIMSVEVDEYYRPQVYWLTPPGTDVLGVTSPQGRVPVAAEHVIHAFQCIDDESQTRGITYFHAGLVIGKNRHEYTKAVVVQAKMTAMMGGVIVPPEGDEAMAEKWLDPVTGEAIVPEVDVTPGSNWLLPPGYDYKDRDPKQPTQNHAEFERQLIHEIASALGLNYFSLAGDMDAVNYSSARVGLAEEREGLWRGLQEFVATHFLNDLFAAWLPAAVASGNLELSPEEIDLVRRPYWRPRGWDYVDPLKEITADVMGLENGLLTFSGILARRGLDLRDHLETVKQDREMFDELGVPYPEFSAKKQTQPKETPPSEEDTAPKDKKRELTIGHDAEYVDDFVS